jgi:hypothetical protein
MNSSVPALQASHQMPANGLPNMPPAGIPNTAMPNNAMPNSMPNMVGSNPGSMPTNYPGAASGALTGSSASYRMADTSPMPSASGAPAAAYPAGQYSAQPSYAPPTGAFPGAYPVSAPTSGGMASPAVAPPGSNAVPAGYRPGSTRESTYDFSRSAPGTSAPGATTAGGASGIPPMPSVGGVAPTSQQYPVPTQYPSSFPSNGTTGLPTYNGGSVTR